MLSAFIIFVVFSNFLILLNSTKLMIDSTSKVIISFIGSLSFLSIIYFWLILFSSQSSWAPKVILQVVVAAFAGLIFLRRYTIKDCFLDLARASGWFVKTFDEESKAAEAQEEQKYKSLYKFIFSASSFAILLANFANSSPVNYDSNTYNVARVAGMIAGSSPLIEQTSVVRQAIYPLSHDIVFYPDILFNNTRGLGLVSGLEFITLMCIISQLSVLFVSCLYDSSIPKSQISNYTVLIFSLCLLISSDMQVMQSVITKNDLIITLCFTSGLYLACRYITNEISWATFILVSAIIVSYSLASKSYGIITVFPSISVLGFVVINKITSIRNRPKTGLRFSLIILFERGKKLITHLMNNTSKMPYISVVLGMSAAQLYIDHRVKQFASSNYAIEVTKNALNWTNTGNGFLEALLIALTNASRSAISIMFYPLTAIPKLGPWLASKITMPILSGILTLDFGIGGGTQFEWPAYTQDASHTSLLVVGFVAFSLLACGRLRQRYKMYYTSNKSQLSMKLSALFIIILFNCLFAFFAITSMILYQPWIGRFLGSLYVPAIPVSSFILAQYFHLASANMRLERLSLRVKTIVPVLSVIMFITHVFRSSFAADLSLALSSGYADIPLSERRYAQYIGGITDSEPATHAPLLKYLRESSFKQRIICTGGNSWVLTPMLLSLKNKAYTGSNVSTLSTFACDVNTGMIEVPNPSSNHRYNSPAVHRIKGVEYIYLP